MARNYPDWLKAYVDYASYSEAPEHMHFFAGVSAMAGALQRRVWIDMEYFRWHANHYIIFVAPPGIVSKSTTVSIAMDLLRRVPGVNFGPDVVTWPALVTAFASVSESFEFEGEWITQCALTLESSEFGNLVNPTDTEMIDLLVNLWDSRTGAFTKKTKGSGNDTVENPWINLAACTTPAWIAGNFPEYVIGGGFTSRCLFIYADKKSKFIAYPSRHVPASLRDTRQKLIDDLIHISAIKGPYALTDAAVKWGETWYQYHYDNPPAHLNDDRFGGYLARKQTHVHKLAMVLAASSHDELIIDDTELALALTMIEGLEKAMPKVFSKIGRSEESIQTERMLKFIAARSEGVPVEAVYRYIHDAFPKLRDFETIFAGAVKAGLITVGPGGVVSSTGELVPTKGT